MTHWSPTLDPKPDVACALCNTYFKGQRIPHIERIADNQTDLTLANGHILRINHTLNRVTACYCPQYQQWTTLTVGNQMSLPLFLPCSPVSIREPSQPVPVAYTKEAKTQ